MAETAFRHAHLDIFIAMILSMFGALSFHGQDFVSTLWAQRQLYYFLFYFLLLKSRPEHNFLTRTIFFLGTIYIVLYIVQTLIYPVTILSCKMFFDRGTLRIFMPGTGLMQMGYFLALYRFFEAYKKRYIVYIIGTLIVLILVGSRQSMAAIVLISNNELRKSVGKAGQKMVKNYTWDKVAADLRKRYSMALETQA